MYIACERFKFEVCAVIDESEFRSARADWTSVAQRGGERKKVKHEISFRFFSFIQQQQQQMSEKGTEQKSDQLLRSSEFSSMGIFHWTHWTATMNFLYYWVNWISNLFYVYFFKIVELLIRMQRYRRAVAPSSAGQCWSGQTLEFIIWSLRLDTWIVGIFSQHPKKNYIFSLYTKAKAVSLTTSLQLCGEIFHLFLYSFFERKNYDDENNDPVNFMIL